jgi:hypothetical protein
MFSKTTHYEYLIESVPAVHTLKPLEEEESEREDDEDKFNKDLNDTHRVTVQCN